MDTTDPKILDTGDFPSVPPALPPRIEVISSARSDVGKVRRNNEDHYLVARLRRSIDIDATNLDSLRLPLLREEAGHLLAVADGMGGMASGEDASFLAISAGLELLRDAAKWHLDVSGPNEIEELVATCRSYIQQINQRVYTQASQDASKEGMGTTLSVAYSVGLRLFVVHVGDSRVYLAHGGTLQQITRDHTVAQDLATTGRITQSEVKSHRMRNVLTNYIGSPDQGIEAEIHRLELHPGDRLLLCSDGLSDQVEDAEIAQILASASEPKAACDRLVDAALKAGGRDNITVIVADYRVESS
ncbi:PP2C family protein-serine/threonine phosphatase [Tautonia rosea]|uniref:PP2C family protein-serine/threonine phosphatase n=1 Tax=Tautonia rosea TaxID=2728037 RepID=UPI001472AE72|nr:protein phosphatase 2C domain-containing protein [Tautonia rosea]